MGFVNMMDGGDGRPMYKAEHHDVCNSLFVTSPVRFLVLDV